MLQKCYECIGRRYTSAGEVPQQVRYIGRRYTSAGEIPRQVRARARAPAPGPDARAHVRARVGELEAGSWELLYTRVGQAGSCYIRAWGELEST